MNISLEPEGEIFTVCYFTLDNCNSPDFSPSPNSENLVFTEICIKFGFSIANFRAIFEVWRRDCCVQGDVDEGIVICDSVRLRFKQPEDCSAIFLLSETCHWGNKTTTAPAHHLHGGCRKVLWERHQLSGGCWTPSPSSRARMSSCLTHASEQQEGCRPQELPLRLQVTELSWQWPGSIFRSGICTSVVESSCAHNPQVTLLPFALRKPPDFFSGSSSEQLSSYVVQSICTIFTFFTSYLLQREALKKPLQSCLSMGPAHLVPYSSEWRAAPLDTPCPTIPPAQPQADTFPRVQGSRKKQKRAVILCL